jgi:PIN domain
MPDSNQTKNVFLDTEIFDHHQLDFGSPNVRRLARLAAAGVLKLFFTVVTEKEIRRHIDKKAADIIKSVKNYRRIGRIANKYIPAELIQALESINEEMVRTGLHTEFDDFLTETRAEVLPLNASLEELFEKYDKQEPPFGPGEKKKEFPDAVAVATLVNWSKANGNEKIYAVGDDGDWRRTCRAEPLLLHVADLPGLLELFADSVLVTTIKAALEAENDELITEMKTKAENFDVYVDDSVPDGEVDAYDCTDINIMGMHVVEAKDGIAIITCECDLVFRIDACADDPDSGIYDHEDKTMHYVYRMSGRITREYEHEATVKVKYDPDHPDDIELLDITFENPEINISFDEGELQRDDDFEDPGIYADAEPEIDPQP